MFTTRLDEIENFIDIIYRRDIKQRIEERIELLLQRTFVTRFYILIKCQCRRAIQKVRIVDLPLLLPRAILFFWQYLGQLISTFSRYTSPFSV